MKLIASVLMVLMLVGCASNGLDAPKIKHYDIQIPEAPRTKCYNSIPAIPNVENMTNRQLIEFLSRLIRSNKICKTSLDSVYTYIEELQKSN